VRGEQSENLVSEFLSRHGFYFVASRWKTPYAEVDLVFKKRDEFYIVEVKSLGKLDFGLVRVSAGQKQRLLRAREWLESQTGSGVALAFAYVLPDKEILLLNADGEALT
jgi:Holliday junction resolvase-like predicted endonuclease